MVITGLIRPPPEIRAVADKTALFVAKNGRAFEARILSSEKDKIKFYEEGGEDGNDNNNNNKNESSNKNESKKTDTQQQQQKQTRNEEVIRKKEKSIKASASDPVAKALLTQRTKIAQAREAATTSKDNGETTATAEEGATESVPKPVSQPSLALEPPPPIQYINILAPSNLTPAQIETIQLVAQFAAVDGKNGPLLQLLAMREWHNPLFGFLQPRHGHFAYFSALVDAYRRILGLWTGRNVVVGAGLDRLVDTMANNVNACLEVAAFRAEYERDISQRAKENLEEDSAVAQIDWHDFVVVETIDFPANEIVLPPPPPPPPKLIPNKPTATVPVAVNQETMDESDDEEDEGERIRVVPSYTPKVVSTGTLVKDRTHVIDPITGKSVPVADMPEHMRIQLLDPKWAEERRKFQEKQKDSNLVSGDVIASNISRFAQARGVGKSEDDSKARGQDAKRDQSQTQSGPSSTFTTSAGSQPSSQGMQYNPTTTDSSSEPVTKRPRLEDTHLPATNPFAPVVGGSPPPSMTHTPTFQGSQQSLPSPPSIAPPGTNAAAPTEPEGAGSESTSQLMPEAEFVATLSKPEVTLQIRVPNDPSQMAWNFYGQIVSLSINVMSKIKVVKEQMSKIHLNDMPSNKIQLKSVQTGAFLKDSLSLAQLNIGPTATLELVPKIRGGRK